MNTLIHIKEEMSLAIISGSSYPIVEVTKENAIIAATTKQSASNISKRTGGEVINTANKEFPYEIHINFEMFDRVLEFETWSEMLEKTLTNSN